MNHLVTRDQPRVYRLQCDGDRIIVEVDIAHRDQIAVCHLQEGFHRLQASIAKENCLEAFWSSPVMIGPWGFGGSLRYDPGDSRWARCRFSVVIPQDQARMLHVAHSLQTLFELLACSPIYPSIPERQSMHVMLWGFDGSDGRSIFSEMSPALVAWLAHDFNEDLQMDVVHLMNKVRQHVCSEPQIRLRAQCFIVNDTLYLHTGLQASLCVQGRKSPVPGRGYELRSDHCDTLLDQFILFAALCRIDQHFYERY